MSVGVTATDEMSGCLIPMFRRVTPPATSMPSARHWRGCNGAASLNRTKRGKWQLLGQNAVLNFFAREYIKLQREWSVTLDEHLESRTLKNIDRVEPKISNCVVGCAVV